MNDELKRFFINLQALTAIYRKGSNYTFFHKKAQNSGISQHALIPNILYLYLVFYHLYCAFITFSFSKEIENRLHQYVFPNLSITMLYR